ncbi:zinc ribbon domain-containing protein [Hoyosella subflava]|uniref:Uncharacterized protein n=1 Tax=Hoyosella subflava (strain DSM 45089 / JCM 17490 / NBRC 109087 / DQS3-9A1) TaxID=443218 RepID=F6EEJ8_HOYSD|nr:C4-type zinc ribbon domain-containing protein [Hoyosella subflava]AEF39695.1 hypothetical protein AS9A_1243 [Hoyosella subflava DQS3-9A1]
MDVDVKVQQKLLDLADVDAELLRIRHRRINLPEDKEIERLKKERQARKDDAVAAEIALDDLDRDIKRLEREVDQVGQREKRDNALMQSGTVAAKQLSELQHELGTLGRRRSLLEDELLDIMEQREAAEENYKHAGARLSHAEEELDAAGSKRGDATADLDVAEKRCDTDREKLTQLFPEELLSLYENERRSHSVGAGRLQGSRCGACRIELDRGELERIKATPPERVVQCPECGAILVRAGR